MPHKPQYARSCTVALVDTMDCCNCGVVMPKHTDAIALKLEDSPLDRALYFCPTYVLCGDRRGEQTDVEKRVLMLLTPLHKRNPPV